MDLKIQKDKLLPGTYLQNRLWEVKVLSNGTSFIKLYGLHQEVCPTFKIFISLQTVKIYLLAF